MGAFGAAHMQFCQKYCLHSLHWQIPTTSALLSCNRPCFLCDSIAQILRSTTDGTTVYNRPCLLCDSLWHLMTAQLSWLVFCQAALATQVLIVYVCCHLPCFCRHYWLLWCCC
jgi:hypothetical protein